MAKYQKRDFQVGDYWLSQRDGSPAWYGTYYEGERRTKRFSLGTDDFEEAKKALARWYLSNREIKDEPPDEAFLADVLRRYYAEHGVNSRSSDHARASVKHWLDFWETATVEDVRNIKKQEEFHIFLQGRMNNNSANRVLDIGKAAINRAYKRGELTNPPHINRLPKQDNGPRGRPMTIEELKVLYGEAAPHLQLFIKWMLGTAARPEAIRLLHSSQVVWDDEIIKLNPEGREQNKKRRPVIKLPPSLASQRFSGFLIEYHGKPIGSLKTAWNKAVDRAKLDEKCNPYSLRHTAAKWMRRNRVTMDEIGQQLGHKEKSTSITAIYTADDPDYLRDASAALDKLVREVTGVRLDCATGNAD